MIHVTNMISSLKKINCGGNEEFWKLSQSSTIFMFAIFILKVSVLADLTMQIIYTVDKFIVCWYKIQSINFYY